MGTDESRPARVSLVALAREWARIGCLGFGGPPTHVAMFRTLCVDRHEWLSSAEFEDGVAATNLLPGPASTQLAMYCAWRLRGAIGAVIGGMCFICPGLLMILVLAAVFLGHPNRWLVAAAAGAGSAVAVVAIHAAIGLAPASWVRAGDRRPGRIRWLSYAACGAAATVIAAPYLVLVVATCGVVEMAVRSPRSAVDGPAALLTTLATPVAVGGLGALSWVAFKVGALSYGGGFVIVPLIQTDAVSRHHWMTAPQFLNAVALGQLTPGPVVHTVAVVGYAAAGVGGGLLAALVAFAPSFAFVLFGAAHFERLRTSRAVQGFFRGAGPAAIGAIAGSAVALSRELSHPWQVGIVLGAASWLLALRRDVVTTLIGAATLGVVAYAVGLPVG